jgi:colanic acid biosynthesis glycosyl transferase WcaI
MRILIVSQWCHPEPDARVFFMAKALIERNHEVQILTGFPNYPGGSIYQGYKNQLYLKEVIQGVEIIRSFIFPSHDNSVFKRALNYLSFSFFATLVGLFKCKKPSVIYIYHPPLTSFIPAYILKLRHRSKLIYDIQDLWPDSLFAVGMVNNSLVINVVTKIQNFIYRNADQITVISQGFKILLIERGVEENKIEVIPNWSIPLGFEPAKPELISLFDDKFNIVFAGNLGKAQALDTIVNAADICNKMNLPEVRFILIGTGVEKERLQEKVNQMSLPNFLFVERISPTQIGGVLKMADVLLIHLKKSKLFSITIPSKLQSYLMMGIPILAGVQGDASEILQVSNAGFVFEPESAESLVDKVQELLKMKKEDLQQLGANGYDFYMDKLSIDSGVNKFEKLFVKLANEDLRESW